MVTTTTPPAAAVAQSDSAAATAVPRPERLGPLFVATDGTSSADPAFIAARLLAHRSGADVNVVTVLERPTVFVPAPYPIALPLDFDEIGAERLRDLAREQMRRLIGEDPGWSIETRFGHAAQTIHRLVRERKAQLLITGVSRHRMIDRMLGEETTADIAQITETPLLAVVAGMTRLPRTVLVAIDLDSPPIPDSEMLRTLLSEVTTMYFVNAKPRGDELPGPETDRWESSYGEAVREAYERVKSSIELAPGVFRQLVSLTGNPAKEIVSFAAYAKVDLIVLGQRRRWMLQRRLGGGLPRRILRATTCSVLVLPRARGSEKVAVPPKAGTHELRTETITERHRWAPRLAQLTRRNAGRQVMLEVDDAEFGAQAQAMEYPLVGMDYDHYDDRIEIMLGARTGRTAHLTHSVLAPTSLDILEGANGSAVAVRVANERGQALLTFVP